MTDHIDQLRARFEKAEQHAQKLMADKDEALDKVRDRYGDRLREANDRAAELQKQLNDAEAVEALRDRPDGERIAKALGLSLGEA